MYQPTAVTNPSEPGSRGTRRPSSRSSASRRRCRAPAKASPPVTVSGRGSPPRALEAERSHRDLHRRGKARVQIEARDVVDADAERSERGRAWPDRGGVGERPPFAEEVVVVRVGPREREDHAISAMPASRAAACEHRSTAAAWSTSMLAHMRLGYGKTTIRLSDVTSRIASAVYATGTRRAGCRPRPPRTCPEPETATWCSSIVCPAAVCRSAVSRRGTPASGRCARWRHLVRTRARTGITDDVGARRVLRATHRGASSAPRCGPPPRIHALGAAEQRDVALAVVDRGRKLVHEQLRRVPADRREHRAAGLAPSGARGAPRVRVVPADDLGDADRVDVFEQARRAGVRLADATCAARASRSMGFEGGGGSFGALRGLAHADDHRGTWVDHGRSVGGASGARSTSSSLSTSSGSGHVGSAGVALSGHTPR